MQSLIGKKIDQTQGFLEDGTRVPLSIISVAGNVVIQVKTGDHEGYNSIQLGFGTWKRPTKPMAGPIKKAGLKKMPRFFREIRADEAPASPSRGGPNLAPGSAILVSEVFEPGDIVDVTGISKGKGFAGVVKLHGFHGGPKTHGQSDRHRAPGAIGSGTTPGRVYKGKRMAGRMGNERVTIKNLEVLDVKDDTIFVRGLIPGVKGSIVTITKVGKNKKFKPLWGGLSPGSGEGEVAVRGERDSGGTEESDVQTAVDNVSEAEKAVKTPEEVETAQDTVASVANSSEGKPAATDGTEESAENTEKSSPGKQEEGEGNAS